MQEDNAYITKALRLLGLARRANLVQFGAEASYKAARQGRAKLLLLASDAGQSTQKRFLRLAEDLQLPIFTVFKMGQFEEALARNKIAVLTVNGEHFATEIQRLLATNADISPENDLNR